MAATKSSYLTMRFADMCLTSMCAFLNHVDPSEFDVFAFIDDTTPSEVRSLYNAHNVKQLYGYNATTFPEPSPEISKMDGFIFYVWVKLLLWNWGQVSGKEYERVLYFDSDFWFVEPPFYLLQKYPLLQPNSVAIRDGPVGDHDKRRPIRFVLNTGLILVRPNATTFHRLRAKYIADYVARTHLFSRGPHQARGGPAATLPCNHDQCWLAQRSVRAMYRLVAISPCDNNKGFLPEHAVNRARCNCTPSFHYIPEVNRSFFVKLKHKVSEGSCRAYPSTATAAESSSSPGRALGSVVERALNQLPPSSNQQRVLLEESPIESTDHVATHSVGAARASQKPAHCTLLDELFPPRETDRGSTQISNVRKNLGIPAMTMYPTREVLFKRLYHSSKSPYVDLKRSTHGGRRLDSAARTRVTFWREIERALGGAAHFIVEVGSFVGGSATAVWGPLAKRAQGLVLCVDSWEGSIQMRLDPSIMGPNVAPLLRPQRGFVPQLGQAFLQRVVDAGLEDTVFPLSMPSITAARLLAELNWKIDVIFLDSAHERGETLVEIQLYYQLLRPGGVLVGDDYQGFPAVRDDVNKFMQCLPGVTLHVLREDTGHRRPNSWMLVKPLDAG